MPLPPNGLPVPFLTRSWLLIPALEEAALGAGLKSGADILCLDFASLPGPDRADAAAKVALFLKGVERAGPDAAGPALFFLLPAPDDETDDLLEQLVPLRPDGVAVECLDGADVQELDVLLAVHEALSELEDGSIRLAAFLAQAFNSDFAGYSRRLVALGWSAEAFRALLGASRMHDSEGRLTTAFSHARASVLSAAALAGVEAIDASSGLFSSERLQRDAQEAAADGFTGKMALSPRQVAAINHAFSPAAEDLAAASALLASAADIPTLERLRAMRTLRRGKIGNR